MAQLKDQNSRVKFISGWLLRALALFLCLWLVFVLTGKALSRIAIAQIAELTNTEIDAKLVDFNRDGSVIIEELVVRPGQENEYNDTILTAKKVYARFSMGSLLLLRPKLKEIRVKDFVFDAQYDVDANRWNIACLQFTPTKNRFGKIPVIRLEKGILKYSKVSNGQFKVISSLPVDAVFGPAEDPENGYSFDLTTAQRSTFGKNRMTGFFKPGMITLTGGISSTNIAAFERSWAIDVLAVEFTYDQSDSYSLKLRIKELRSTRRPIDGAVFFEEPSFLKKTRLFSTLQRFFNRYNPAGQADIDLEVRGNLREFDQSMVAGKVYCRDVAILDRKFPYFIENIEGQIDFTEKSVLLNNLRGWHRDVKLFFNGWSKDFGPNYKCEIRTTSDNMALDNDLYNALSNKQKKVWSIFSPSGVAEIDYCFTHQLQTNEKKILKIKPINVEAVYCHFPYPLKNVTGTLSFERGSTTISNVVSQFDGRKIVLNGKVTPHGTSQPTYDISIDADNIPLDSTLVAALPDEQKDFCSRLSSDGTIRIKKLASRFWSANKSRQLCYSVSIQSQGVQLNNNLFSLLPITFQRIVSEVQPEGQINLNINLSKDDTNNYPDYKITIDCLNNSVNIEKFPYPLKDVTGSLIITKNGVEFQGIAATAGSLQIAPNVSTIKVDGQIAVDGDILSNGQFEVRANDISLDKRLGVALPQKLRPFYLKLEPAGQFDLDLKNLRIFNDQRGEKQIDFTGAIKLKDCSFNSSVDISELNGVLKIKGSYKTEIGLCGLQTNLIAESLKIEDKALTAIKADIGYEPNEQIWSAKNLVADCYDGRFMGAFELKQTPNAEWDYLLQTSFDNIDLKRFLHNAKNGKTNGNGWRTSGKMRGAFSLNSNIGDDCTRLGKCRLQITDMQVGKLSPLAKLLQVLKLTEPTDYAFDQMLVDSYIRGDNVFFEKFDLSGDAIAFNGSGRLDLQNYNIDLTLTARGQRLANAEPSVLQSLTEDLGRGVVRMDITGSVYDPQVETKTLPIIGESLGIIGKKPAKSD